MSWNTPLQCACCDQEKSSKGFVTITKAAGYIGMPDGRIMRPGDPMRIECAIRMGLQIPKSVAWSGILVF
jgi:hypothetical protein